MFAAAAERRHKPTADLRWHESWDFDCVAPDLSWAMFARLGLYPNRGVAWWWSAIARAGQPVLLVRDDSLALPRAHTFELRGSALWADLTCHEPMRRWQVNFEGIALGLDDPAEAFRGERGDRVPIEFEFEWESDGSSPQPVVDGYGQRGVVHGEVNFGSGGQALTVDDPVPGYRSHTWGLDDWWTSAPRSAPELFDERRLEAGLVFEASDGVRTNLHRVASRRGWVQWCTRDQVPAD